MPKRGDPAHWRDESRSGVPRPTLPILRATFAGRSVPRSAPLVFFRHAPGAPRDSSHAANRLCDHPNHSAFRKVRGSIGNPWRWLGFSGGCVSPIVGGCLWLGWMGWTFGWWSSLGRNGCLTCSRSWGEGRMRGSSRCGRRRRFPTGRPFSPASIRRDTACSISPRDEGTESGSPGERRAQHPPSFAASIASDFDARA